ncbi:heterotrimeric G protein alpha subunit A [Piromyces finnis]|uniref:Heterotrimeric G protein alpha subunit A n=1 Tax=Piromyces finnis TaxID=1754191 RepID=A0A1Y1V1M2_9FUNG|nr:heterotrimeric G protein alpha subunit A [Piromyces finnis]|eukprot:ORX45191.1 heterotrimeric G protein alpha subunit A [Piromyces finnis]
MCMQLFGCFRSKEEKEEKSKSDMIDKAIQKDKQRLKKEYKMLLLGPGESGKSTIFKQMKIINQNGYMQEELEAYKSTIYQNVLDCFFAMIEYAKCMNQPFSSDETQEIADRLENDKEMIICTCKVTKELANDIYKVINDENTEKIMTYCYEHPQQYYLIDSTRYFFDNVLRIGEQDYLPTEQDILCARCKTTGITETHFTYEELNIHLFDVGGQRSERRKWISCFEAVTSIIFCVALSEYDQTLIEDNTQNRMVESLMLFDSVVNSRWFIRTSIILFLNKYDLFVLKLKNIPLEKFFPDYSGEKDPKKAAQFIRDKFLQKNKAKLAIFPHLTQATDTKNIKHVFFSVYTTIVQNALKDSGIM